MDDLEKAVEECEILLDNSRAALDRGDVKYADELFRRYKNARVLLDTLFDKALAKIDKKAR